jgi:hypothetical protein
MDPLSFLNHTAHKLKDSKHEADQRTVASRSYYAVYHKIRELLKTAQVPLDDDHGSLYNCFFLPNMPPEVRTIGKNLQTLYDFRRRADYKLHDSWYKTDSEKSYSLAHQIMETFRRLFDGETKTLIANESKIYMKNKRSRLN